MSQRPPSENSKSAGIVYYLDDRDTIVRVSATWNDFAQENGGLLQARDVLGQPLFRYITGEPTRMYLNVIFEGVRTLKRGKVTHYRCDSPDLRRHMEMTVSWEEPHLLRLEHRCVQESIRPTAIGFRFRPGPGAVRCCSICNRLERDGTWQDAGIAVPARAPVTVDVAWCVCENCLAASPSAEGG